MDDSEDQFWGICTKGLERRTGTIAHRGNPAVRWTSLGTGPTLVCCNGVFTSSMFWSRSARKLAERYQMVLWDYPGHGSSVLGAGAADVSIPVLARYVERLGDAVGASSMVLLGHSMGGQVALETCYRLPTRVAGLVLIAPTAGRLRDWRRYGPSLPILLGGIGGASRLTRAEIRQLVERVLRSKELCRVLLRLHVVHPRRIEPGYLDRYLLHVTSLNPEVVIRLMEEADRHDAIEYLIDLRAPTLIIAGDRDPLVTYRFCERLAAAMPSARLRPLLGATHALPLEFPSFVARYIDDFVQELLASTTGSRSDGRTPLDSASAFRHPGASSATAAWSGMNSYEALHQLLMDLFTYEELQLWIRHGPSGYELLRHLPIGGSYAAYVSAVVDAQRARGLIDQEFFERLMQARPRREQDVFLVAKLWSGG